MSWYRLKKATEQESHIFDIVNRECGATYNDFDGIFPHKSGLKRKMRELVESGSIKKYNVKLKSDNKKRAYFYLGNMTARYSE